jgi:hypothetical protein
MLLPNTVREFIYTLLILLCSLLVWFRRRQKASKEKEEWDIREETFLYQTRGLGENACYLEATYTPGPKVTDSASSESLTSPQPHVGIALPDEFMKRMTAKGSNLKRRSECEATAQGVVDKQTGEKGGYVFTVGDIFWISPTDVEVSGSLCVGSTAAARKTYYLKKKDGKWVIVGEHLKSISPG